MRALLCLVLAGMIHMASSSAFAEGEWAVTLYGGMNSPDSITDVFEREARYTEDYLVGLCLARRVGSSGRSADVEVEGQVVRHFNREDHWEANGLVTLRWKSFPWDRRLDTSLAAGAGISLASEISDLESSPGDPTRRVLAYLMIETDFSLPSSPRWALVFRLHHRSGLFGTFGGERDAANALGFGVRYRF